MLQTCASRLHGSSRPTSRRGNVKTPLERETKRNDERYFWQSCDFYLQWGKNLVSDGHFCKSFCPASHKISISGDFRHCCRVMIYLDCVMSKNHDLLQNKSLRNRLIIAASVMEFISTTPKNAFIKKYAFVHH